MIRLRQYLRSGSPISPGVVVIAGLMLASAAWVAVRPVAQRDGLSFWVFARTHYQMYVPVADRWREAGGHRLDVALLSADALPRRLIASMHAGTHMADLVEIERSMASQVFSGPIDGIGLIDLTDRLHAEGLYDRFNEPSFAPWTVSGRVFGLPHDVHPVLLCYRADLVEEAGIDITSLTTWASFKEAMRAMVVDLDGDGRPDRYPLSLSETHLDQIEALLLQAGGGLFDIDGVPTLASDVNAATLAEITTWLTGPGRIAGDAPEFSASGNRLRLEGYVVCSLMSDWLTSVWESDLPQLEGKLRLMPLPAWEPGGRRTSVWGGTMIGIPKTTPDPEQAWAVAKELYLSEPLARELYERAGIISPVRALWDRGWYAAPRAYFGGQRTGRLYLEQAPDVPRRVSSPFDTIAKAGLQDVVIQLKRHAEETGVYDAAALQPVAKQLLEAAEARVRWHMNRNVFVRERSP